MDLSGEQLLAGEHLLGACNGLTDDHCKAIAYLIASGSLSSLETLYVDDGPLLSDVDATLMLETRLQEGVTRRACKQHRRREGGSTRPRLKARRAAEARSPLPFLQPNRRRWTDRAHFLLAGVAVLLAGDSVEKILRLHKIMNEDCVRLHGNRATSLGDGTIEPDPAFYHNSPSEGYLITNCKGIACIYSVSDATTNVVVKHNESDHHIIKSLPEDFSITDPAGTVQKIRFNLSVKEQLSTTSAAFAGVFGVKFFKGFTRDLYDAKPKDGLLLAIEDFVLPLYVEDPRFLDIAPEIKSACNDQGLQHTFRCGDGALFDQHALFSLLSHFEDDKASTLSVAVLNNEETNVQEWVYKNEKVHKHFPDIAMFVELELKGVVRFGEKAAIKKYRARDLKNRSIYVYLVEIYAASFKSVDTLPHTPRAIQWAEVASMASQVAKSAFIPKDLVGIACSGGGFKSSTMTWGFLFRMNQLKKLTKLKAMSGTSGGAWGIYLYENNKAKAYSNIIEFIYTAIERLQEASDDCEIPLRYPGSNATVHKTLIRALLGVVSPKIKFLSWLESAKMNWAKIVDRLLDIDEDSRWPHQNYKVYITFCLLRDLKVSESPKRC